jgi:hypothetical protein
MKIRRWAVRVVGVFGRDREVWNTNVHTVGRVHTVGQNDCGKEEVVLSALLQ